MDDDEIEAEVARIMAMSDEEILADAVAQGIDLELQTLEFKAMLALAKRRAGLADDN
jgi:hypothetical protein